MALTKVSTGMLSADVASIDLNIDANTMYIDVSNNRVGINNAAPSTALDVTGTVTADGLTVEAASGAEAARFVTNDATAANNAGALIYNIASATAATRNSQLILDPSGANASGGDYLIISAKGDNSASIINYHANSTLALGTAGVERMRISSSGNVGIGTSSPSYKADILATNQYALRLNTTDADGCFLAIQTNGTAKGYLGTSHHLVAGTPSEDDITLRAENNLQFTTGGGTERMRIDGATGNVGIGTNSPNGNGILTLNTPADISTQIVFAENDTAKWLIGHRHDGDYFRFYDLANSAERMRIDSAGHAIIPAGVTLGTAAGVYAAANTLEDYEEGTWTVTANTTGVIISSQNCRYTKVGRLVTLNGSITFSALPSNISTIQLSGAPYTCWTVHTAGIVREVTTVGAIYVMQINQNTTNLAMNSYSGVANGSARIFAINEGYNFSLTYTV